jgi:hypothetical protein
MLFGVVDVQGQQKSMTIGELCRSQAVVFSPGLRDGREIPPAVAEAVWAFEPEALLLLVLPDAEFGILELRHWAAEEYLVPVPAHQRCAYGLRLVADARPFPFHPTELARLGIPVASGPRDVAVLDHRDLMAEAKPMPTGGSAITAVLNRRHPEMAAVIKELSSFRDITKLRSTLGKERHALFQAFELGRENRYNAAAGVTVVDALSSACLALGISCGIHAEGAPNYMDGGEVLPFGRFALSPETISALAELQGLDGPRIRLS